MGAIVVGDRRFGRDSWDGFWVEILYKILVVHLTHGRVVARLGNMCRSWLSTPCGNDLGTTDLNRMTQRI